MAGPTRHGTEERSEPMTEQARRSATAFTMAGLGVEATTRDAVDTRQFYTSAGVSAAAPATQADVGSNAPPDGAGRTSGDVLGLILRSSRFTPAESSMLTLLMNNPRR